MVAYRRLAVLFIAGVLLPVFPASSIEQIQLHLGDLRGAGWSARDVTVEYSLGENNRGQLTFTAKESQWPAPVGRIRSSRITCADLRFEAATIECRAGTLQGSNELLGAIEGRLQFQYTTSNSAASFTITKLKLSGGVVSLQGNIRSPDWEFSLTGTGLRLEPLVKLAAALGVAVEYETSGALDLEVRISGSADKVAKIKTSSAFSAMKFNNAAGTHAGEALGGQSVQGGRAERAG